MNKKPKYSCSKCGLAVIIIEGKAPIYACNCKAPIIAEMSGKATGIGEVKAK